MKGKLKIVHCFLLSSILLAGVKVQAQQAATLVQAGKFIASEKIQNGFGIQTTDAYISVISYGPSIIRIRFLKDKDAANKRNSFAVIALPENNLNLKEESDEQLILETDSLLVAVNKNPVRIESQRLTRQAVERSNEYSCNKDHDEAKSHLGRNEDVHQPAA